MTFLEPAFLSPVLIKYDGLAATDHFIDAELVGKSLEGTAILYKRALFVLQYGRNPAYNSVYPLKMYTKAPTKGSVEFIQMAMVVGQFALYPDTWTQLADWFISSFVEGVKAYALGKENNMQTLIDVMLDEQQRNREFTKDVASMAIQASLADKSKLYDLMASFAESNKRKLIDVVEPVGRSCATLEHRIGTKPIFCIDEPAAEVIRAKEPLELSDMTTYEVILEGVDETNGSCKVLIGNHILPGKITDPALKTEGNVYALSLYKKLPLIVKAKATLKDGAITKLYISDASHKPA